jgi:hypothetical protein
MQLVDVTHPLMSVTDEVECQALLEANYGMEYSGQKVSVLFELLREENWSGERLKRVTKWICKNLKWATWTTADFMTAPLGNLYNYAWVLEEVHKDRSAMKRMEAWKVSEGVVLWRYADGTDLPYERVHPKAND